MVPVSVFDMEHLVLLCRSPRGLPTAGGVNPGAVVLIDRKRGTNPVVSETALHEVDPAEPGIVRRRAGRGFRYLHPSGRPVRAKATLARIRALVIPPAWEDVWISPDPRGHIQAVGTDARGRRQYRYHDDWRVERDAEKHDRAIELAKTLPRLRARVADDLAAEGMGRDRVLAAAIRLLERGLFRVGGERYRVENASFGLATLGKRHVRIEGGRMVFDYPAKSGQRRRVTIEDPDLLAVVAPLKRRRSGGDELLAYKDERGRWTDVRSDDLNDYLHAAVGDGFTSKDLRTWLGTVLAAVALAAEEPAGSDAARRRQVAHAVKWVAAQLGNTPAVARHSYVDPRVIDAHENGTTLDLDAVAELDDLEDLEPAVIDLVEQTETT
jgi:DNA topoisomerase IB